VLPPPRAQPPRTAPSVPALLALWLLVGAVLGCALAVLSLLVPGALPAFG
jgi:LPS O-antigen subunit length determinant protein (WzzB/FepE family)